MNLHQLIFTENACYKSGRKITPRGIMVHSTGANNPMLSRYVGPDDGFLGKNRYNNHWNQPMNTQVCVHGFIGKLADGSVATYQTLPWDHRGWHAGGSANNTHIGFEICEDGLEDGEYFREVYREAVELCAYLCKKYGLTEKDIICHSEGYRKGIASNHADVMHWFPKHGKSMDTFRADVKALLEQNGATESDVTPAQPAPVPEVKIIGARSKSERVAGTYRVNGRDGNLNLRAGPGTDHQLIAVIPNGTTFRCYGYHTGNWLYGVTDSGIKGYFYNDRLKRI